MLSPKNRLKLDSDFKRVKEQGKLFQSTNFALAVFDRGDQQGSRFGFVVSTKISKSAVVRNRVKRALRSAVADIVEKTKKGTDVIFLVKSSILQLKSENIAQEVERVMKSVNLL